MKVLACYSLKGGVGKTTTSVCLAHISATLGFRTLLFDLDTQGSATWLLRTKRSSGNGLTKAAKGVSKGEKKARSQIVGSDYDNLDLLPYGIETIDLDLQLSSMKRPEQGASRILGLAEGDYDLVVVDLPPSAGNLAQSVLKESDRVIFVMTPSMLSIHALVEAKDRIPTVAKQKTSVLFTMVQERRKTDLAAIELVESENNHVLSTRIVKSTLFDRMQEKRAPIALSAPNSKASHDYHALFEEVSKMLDLDKLR